MLPTLQELKLQFGSDKRVVFKEEIVDSETFTIVFYQIADNQFWEQPFATEVRGHVFDSTGKCVSAALEKFFNLNEQKNTQQDVLDFTNCVSYEKEDGSQITTLVLNDKVYLKTKKTFYSDVAINANKNIKTNEISLVKHLDEFGYTSIFEYTDPEWQIVVNYGNTPKFTLLAARHKETGEYLTREILESVAIIFDVTIVKEYKLSLEEMLSEVDNVTEREGYVILLKNGTRIKLKFSWYSIQHRVRTMMRERDVAEMIVDETIDDIKSVVVDSGQDISLIENIEKRVVSELTEIREYVENQVRISQGQDIRKVAERYKKDSHSYLIFRTFKGQDVDYVKFWKDYYLKQYSLKCVYNTKF